MNKKPLNFSVMFTLQAKGVDITHCGDVGLSDADDAELFEFAIENRCVMIPINHIERKPNSEKYRIVGKGVTVEFLVQFINDSDWSVEHISENYDLTPAEIYSAWAFYYDHQHEIDARLEKIQQHDEFHQDDNQEAYKRLRSRIESDTD